MTSGKGEPLNAILGIIKEIDTCEKAGATTAAIVLTYVGIDAMAYLSMPASQISQTRTDFINWVNKYLKGHPDQVYQYDGKDVYRARCAIIHTYSVEADYHHKNAGTVFTPRLLLAFVSYQCPCVPTLIS
jgi:hypothetical protein